MRLLGVTTKDRKEMLLLQDKNRFLIKEKSDNDIFDNYELIKNRDTEIGNEEKSGEGVFNFRYGPVTAGVAEAGVFNIKTYGERILSVSIDPSYKKRNIENLMVGKTPEEAIKLAESVCGNFAFSHSLAFSRAVEKAFSIKTDEKTERLRIIGLELERIYNHIHVIARLSKGAAQNVLTSHLEWLFEESLRTNKLFSENRFLKNTNGIGHIKAKEKNLQQINRRITQFKEKFTELYEHSLKSWNFIDRIYQTAVLTKERALAIGITGPSLRATGVDEDLRKYDEFYNGFKPCVKENGDALARMEVRASEIVQSCNIITSQIKRLKMAESENSQKIEPANTDGIGVCESPSGILVYYIQTKGNSICNVYISTPSVFGYKAFADTLVGHIFTDFSFALDSYGINFADCAR